MSPEFYYDIQLDLKASPEQLWPFVADTNRFNRDAGLPTVQRLGVKNGVSKMRSRLPVGVMEWDENSFEWTYPYHFGVDRTYQSGPFLKMRVRCELTPHSAGTKLRYQVWVEPRGLLGNVVTSIGLGWMSVPRFEKTFLRYDELAIKGQSLLDLPGASHLAPGGGERLEAARKRLEELGHNPQTVARLTELLLNADDLSLLRMRPYALADYWKTPRRSTLELFLQASRLGLLDMRWEMICPMCRGAADSVGSLSEVHAAGHCETCEVDFTANFDEQVEVTFRPGESIRPLADQMIFCTGSPQREPHIHITENVEAGESRSLGTMLTPGPYNIYVFGKGIEKTIPLNASPEGERQLELTASRLPEASEISLIPFIRLQNDLDTGLSIVLEKVSRENNAATAADVTSIQLFRDMFSREALRAGEEMTIQSVTLMFTDLRESTRMYRQIGDGPAFGRVREHFEILEKTIAAEGGAVVKTIGDAVMAVFRQPVGAFKAINSAFDEISARGGSPELNLKVGIHSGPCIAVTLNERLDYFGSTVNIAARLPGLAQGGEIIFSREVLNDPEVQGWLKTLPQQAGAFKSNVKGFDDPFDLWRLLVKG